MTTKISGANISSIGNTGLNWQAVTVADGSTTVNATSGNGYLLDTNAGVIEVFLPTTPTRGDTVVLADYSGTFATNRVIVNTGGVLIDSTATGDVQLTTNNIIAEFVYVDSAKGWLVKLNQAAGTTPSSALTGYSSTYDTLPPFIQATGGTITTDGDFKIHTFTGDGCFVVTQAGLGTTCQPSVVDYLVVAGGGGGSHGSGGGGGAGGYREGKAAASPTVTASPHTASPLAVTTGITITATTYPITVGAGGTGGSYGPGSPAPSSCGANNGSNSVFSTITSTGGGGAGTGSPSPTCGAGQNGGSGGGGNGGYGQPVYPGTAGNGNTPPVAPPQGNPGGVGVINAAPVGGYSGGGGGGATVAGANGSAPNGQGGAGGAGATTNITGSPVARSGGGGASAPTNGAGGTGGGGAGTRCANAIAGTANTGGGGGGASNPVPSGFVELGGAGGKGIVILRYKFQ